MIDELTPLQYQRRTKILEAASLVFSSVGYHKTEMSKIARESGVGKGTLYRYFANKEELFLKTVENQANQLYQYVFEKLKPFEDPKEFLSMFFEYVINYCHKNSKTFDILYLSSSVLLGKASKIIEKVKTRYSDKLSGRFDSWIKEGLVTPINKDIMIDICSYSVFILMYEFHYKKKYNPDEIKENLVRLFSTGLLTSKNHRERSVL